MNLRGLSALLSSIVLFSTIEVASKLMQSGEGSVAGSYPFWLAFFRFFLSGLVLLGPAFHRLRLRQQTLSWKDFSALSGLGLLGVTLMSSLYHLAITFLPANIAALVFSCNPVFVILFAPLLLPEKITMRKVGAVLLCLVGIVVLAQDRSGELSVSGLLIMLAAIMVFALYTVCFKKATPTYGALPVTAFAALIGGICIFPIAVGFEGLAPVTYGVADWMGIIYLALIGTELAYFLFVYGIRYVEASIGSMAFFMKPFLAALFAWLILGEKLSGFELAGGGLILLGMLAVMCPFYGSQKSGKNTKKKKSD
jgi:drug/metabolite transporter (DMT)-like permease